MRRSGKQELLTIPKPCLECGRAITIPACLIGETELLELVKREKAVHCFRCISLTLCRMTIVRHGDVGNCLSNRCPGHERRMREHAARIAEHEKKAMAMA